MTSNGSPQHHQQQQQQQQVRHRPLQPSPGNPLPPPPLPSPLQEQQWRQHPSQQQHQHQRRKIIRIDSQLIQKLLIVLLVLVCTTTIWIFHHTHTTSTTDTSNNGYLFPFGPSSSKKSSSSTSSSSTSSTLLFNSSSSSSSAACLLVMDDNHFLIEWLAYHYHTLNLRTVIIASDPNSMTSPTPILERWKKKKNQQQQQQQSSNFFSSWSTTHETQKDIDSTVPPSMNIIEWFDLDFMTPKEFHMAQQDVWSYFGDQHMTIPLAKHRARQRLFYHACLNHLKDIHNGWTLLIDTDEFIRLSYSTITTYNTQQEQEQQEQHDRPSPKEQQPSIITPLPMTEPGSVFQFLQQHATTTTQQSSQPIKHDDEEEGKKNKDENTTEETKNHHHHQAWDFLQSSPCVQIPRLRFSATDSPSEILQQALVVPTSTIQNDSTTTIISDGNKNWNVTNFQTLRWRYHSIEQDYKSNKVSKAIIDLSRISKTELQQQIVDSIHLPIRKYCSQRRLHIQVSQSFLVAHHYMGTRDQFIYRGMHDARIGKSGERTVQQFEYLNRTAMKSYAIDDTIRSWFIGFIQSLATKQQQQFFLNEKNPSHSAKHGTAVVANNDVVNNYNNKEEEQDWAHLLLSNVGQLERHTSWQPLASTDRCAILFFGLPRSFRELVLPSIIQNILIPNAKHNCDVYVHFFLVEKEDAGRKNRGGTIHSKDIFLLQQATIAVQNHYGTKSKSKSGSTPPPRVPIVAFTHDTEADFWKQRGTTLERYHTTLDPDGQPLYFPYKAKTYTNISLDNMVKQWHSIEKAFLLMDVTTKQQNEAQLLHYIQEVQQYQQQQRDNPSLISSNAPPTPPTNITYSRVGMFRSDCMYLTPINIAHLDRGAIDSQNNHAVIPAFARRPVNDRMIYGPYPAVKIWATKRFQLIEERVANHVDRGMAMHSERFLDGTVFPAMKAYYSQLSNTSSPSSTSDVAVSSSTGGGGGGGGGSTGFDVHWHRDICFVRARADVSVMANDCTIGGQTRGWNTSISFDLIQQIAGRNCTQYKMGFKWIFAGCGEGIRYYSEFY